MNMGGLVPFHGLFLSMNAASGITWVVPELVRGGVGMQRVREVLDEAPQVAHRPDALDLSPLAREISFRDVSFSYSGERPNEEGTHVELLARGGIYARLWHKQSGFHISDDGDQARVAEGERLRSIPILEHLTKEMLRQVARLFTTEQRPAGRVVIQAGDPGDRLYILVRGRVKDRELAPVHLLLDQRVAVVAQQRGRLGRQGGRIPHQRRFIHAQTVACRGIKQSTSGHCPRPARCAGESALDAEEGRAGRHGTRGYQGCAAGVQGTKGGVQAHLVCPPAAALRESRPHRALSPGIAPIICGGPARVKSTKLPHRLTPRSLAAIILLAIRPTPLPTRRSGRARPRGRHRRVR